MNPITLTKKIQIRFRSFRDSDASALLECIKDEYAESYFKRNFYQVENLIQENRSGHIRFFVATLENGFDRGKVIGMLALKNFFPHEEMIEIASQIFLKEYRGYGMAFPFFQYILEEINRIPERISAIYCLPVLFHDVTQRLMERLEILPTGFIFGVFLMTKIKHSYRLDGNLKHPQEIMIRKRDKNSVGTMFIPEIHGEIARKIYSYIDVEYQIVHESNELHGESEIIFSNDPIQQNCEIEILNYGNDLVEKIQNIHSKFNSEFQTFNVLLNINDPCAILAYEKLIKLGYFFTGFKPLCSAREIMVLHNSNNIPIKFDSLNQLTPRFSMLRDYVKNCYERRI